MKHLKSLGTRNDTDFIIITRGVPDTDEKGVINWIEPYVSNGKNIVDGIYFHVPVRDQYGNEISRACVWIGPKEVKMLQNAIDEIEAYRGLVTVEDDLPF